MIWKLEKLFGQKKGKGAEAEKPSKERIKNVVDQKLTQIFREDDRIPIETYIPYAISEISKLNIEKKYGLTDGEMIHMIGMAASYHTGHRGSPGMHVDVPGIMQQVREAFTKKEENVPKPTVPKEDVSLEKIQEETEKIIRKYAEETERTGKPGIVEIRWEMDPDSPDREKVQRQVDSLRNKIATETGLDIRGYSSLGYHIVRIGKKS